MPKHSYKHENQFVMSSITKMAGVQKEISVRWNTSANYVVQPTTPKYIPHLTQKLSTDKIDKSTTKPSPPNKTIQQNLIQKVANANVVTPIKVETFKQWLLVFPKKELPFLLDGFTYGFKIPFQGERNTEFMKIVFRPSKT